MRIKNLLFLMILVLLGSFAWGASKLVILSPHNEAHRREITNAFTQYYKQKYKKQNYLLIVMILLAGIIQSTSSILFPEKADIQTLPSNIFLMLTYTAVAFGIYAYYKLSYSAAILLSIISMYMSIQNLIIHEKMIAEIFYYLVISAIGLIIICMSGILYSKYFRGYDIKPVGKGENNRMETYVFKEEK